jgi:uncharacterized phage protein (TIGR01671 family)
MNCNGVCRDCHGGYTRERLFRGKSFDTGKWFVGCYIWEVFRVVNDQKVRLISLSDGNRVVHVDPKTIGEFTGALTANGTKIFEGDIIDLPRWVVSYSTGMKCCSGMQVGWYIQRDNWESWTELQDTDRFVIIGNIHDNPELLEAE